ncbi:MAG TPA: glycoside hydrolase family 15 protein, partial [Solirubrobacterales bacterium]
MRGIGAALALVAAGLAAGLALSGGSATDPPPPRGFPGVRPSFLDVGRGRGGRVDGMPAAMVRDERRWLARAQPLGPAAPAWARRMQARSLLVLRALTDPSSGAAVAGPRAGWGYVWPRDAAAVAIAFAQAGYRAEARRVVSFLRGVDLDAAARFYSGGGPVPGRDAQGDAAGWVAAAEQAVGVARQRHSAAGESAALRRASRPGVALVRPVEWRDRADYQEKEDGAYLANAIAAGAASHRTREAFASPRGLVRRADDSGSGLDSAAAWAVRPFARRGLFGPARQTLLRLAAKSGHFGLLPSEDWDG